MTLSCVCEITLRVQRVLDDTSLIRQEECTVQYAHSSLLSFELKWAFVKSLHYLFIFDVSRILFNEISKDFPFSYEL